MRRLDSLAVRQVMIVAAVAAVTVAAFAAANVMARLDPSTAWVSKAMVAAVLLCLAIIGLIAAPADAFSVWARVSRGLVLWGSRTLPRTAAVIFGLLATGSILWLLGPHSVHQMFIRCNGAGQLQSRAWDGSVSITECKELATLSMWQPLRTVSRAHKVVACLGDNNDWQQLESDDEHRHELHCPPRAGASSGPMMPFEVFVHDRELNLSSWQFVPPDRAGEKLSAGRWTDRMKVRRHFEKVTSFCIRHASSGQPTPDFMSSTHPLTVTETTERPVGGSKPKLRIFDVCADVSGEPVESWFTVDITATYWNAFNKLDGAWAALPLPHGATTATFTVRFPETRPPKEWERREGSRDTDTSDLVTDNSVTVTEDGRRIKWSIRQPRRNWVYKFVWTW